MPLYDFQCDDCGHIEERLVECSQHSLPCPDCKSAMRRLFPRGIRAVTDREFHTHLPSLAKQFAKRPRELAILRARARARGISLSAHDHYDGSIATGALDPLAVVPHDDARSYTIRRHGKVHEQRQRAFEAEQKEKKPPLAPDIVERLVRSRVRANPDLAASQQSLNKLREDVINRHAPVTS